VEVVWGTQTQEYAVEINLVATEITPDWAGLIRFWWPNDVLLATARHSSLVT